MTQNELAKKSIDYYNKAINDTPFIVRLIVWVIIGVEKIRGKLLGLNILRKKIK